MKHELKALNVELLNGATATITRESGRARLNAPTYRYDVYDGRRLRTGTTTDPVDAFRAVLALLDAGPHRT